MAKHKVDSCVTIIKLSCKKNETSYKLFLKQYVGEFGTMWVVISPSCSQLLDAVGCANTVLLVNITMFLLSFQQHLYLHVPCCKHLFCCYID